MAGKARASQTIPPATGDALPAAEDDLLLRALKAAESCVRRVGLQKVSMDDIAAESGISRATLYRRIGGRDTILSELLLWQSRPFLAEGTRVAAAAATLAERLELSTMYAVLQADRDPTLKQLFGQGVSPASLDFVRPVYRQLGDATLLPALAAARAAGELRPGLDNDDVVEWLLSNFLLLVSEGPWEKKALQRRIRQFILPVLIPDAVLSGVAAATRQRDPVERRLATLDHRMAEVQQALGMLRLEVGDLRGPGRGKPPAAD